jgi:hypothetical protein
MKFAIPLFLALVLLSLGFVPATHASEAATDCDTAIETLAAGIEVHPTEAVVLFQDSLQTNPACRRQLFTAAVEFTGAEADLLTRLIFVARTEFPEDDTLFAEAAMSVAPERSMEIREAFMADPGTMTAALTNGAETAGADSAVAAASQKMDAEIADAIARVAAKTEGKPWPEQQLADEPLQFRKPDEVRVSKKFREADESSLANTVPVDTHDEREITPGPVKLDDTWKRANDLRLDESKFTPGDRSASTGPRQAGARHIAPAGPVGLPMRPTLPKSSVYYIAPAAENYRSTIDYESGEDLRPPLVIRPVQTSPTLPR